MSEQEGLFSLKILIHRICLTKLAFPANMILQKPGFKIKFVDYPHMIIMAKSSIYLEDFQEKDTFLTGKKEEVKMFNKGKSTFFKAKPSQMFEYLKSYALVIQLKDFLHGAHTTVGKTLLNMDMFLKDVKQVISDDIERFRRNTFRLTDVNNNCVGWFDMSISILQRPNVYLKKVILKSMSPEELQAYQQEQLKIQKAQQAAQNAKKPAETIGHLPPKDYKPSQYQQQQQQYSQTVPSNPKLSRQGSLNNTSFNKQDDYKPASNLPSSSKISRQGSFSKQEPQIPSASSLSRQGSFQKYDSNRKSDGKIPVSQQQQQSGSRKLSSSGSIKDEWEHAERNNKSGGRQLEEESAQYDDDFEVSEMQQTSSFNNEKKESIGFANNYSSAAQSSQKYNQLSKTETDTKRKDSKGSISWNNPVIQQEDHEDEEEEEKSDEDDEEDYHFDSTEQGIQNRSNLVVKAEDNSDYDDDDDAFDDSEFKFDSVEKSAQNLPSQFKQKSHDKISNHSHDDDNDDYGEEEEDDDDNEEEQEEEEEEEEDEEEDEYGQESISGKISYNAYKAGGNRNGQKSMDASQYSDDDYSSVSLSLSTQLKINQLK